MASSGREVPVWALATRPASDPVIAAEQSMTASRLKELRTALASMAESPVATLEAHDVPSGVDRRGGIHLNSASPLASHLAQLLRNTPKVAATPGTETLYRMVVPAKVAAQVGSGLVKPMVSKGAANGIYGALMGPTGIVANATYVPVVGRAAAAGAAGGSAATAGVAAASAGALTVAAPLVLMAVAVGVSAHADKKRAEAIEKVTGLLEKLHSDAITAERDNLNGCVDAIEKATAVLLDEGRVGPSLGLDSAVHAINRAIVTAEARLTRWKGALPADAGMRVELSTLKAAFAGIDEAGGEFRAHLEIAALAIALKKRVIVLQAVEHSQLDKANEFEAFTRTLKADQLRVAKLEKDISELLLTLSSLRLDRSRGVRDVVFRAGEVDKLLDAAYRLRNFGDDVLAADDAADVVIDIVQESDGSVVVFPAQAA